MPMWKKELTEDTHTEWTCAWAGTPSPPPAPPPAATTELGWYTGLGACMQPAESAYRTCRFRQSKGGPASWEECQQLAADNGALAAEASDAHPRLADGGAADGADTEHHCKLYLSWDATCDFADESAGLYHEGCVDCDKRRFSPREEGWGAMALFKSNGGMLPPPPPSPPPGAELAEWKEALVDGAHFNWNCAWAPAAEAVSAIDTALRELPLPAKRGAAAASKQRVALREHTALREHAKQQHTALRELLPSKRKHKLRRAHAARTHHDKHHRTHGHKHDKHHKHAHKPHKRATKA